MTTDELQAHIKTLEQHVARLEGIIQVILEEIEAGNSGISGGYSRGTAAA